MVDKNLDQSRAVDKKAYKSSYIDNLAVEPLLEKNLLSLKVLETFSQYVINLCFSRLCFHQAVVLLKLACLLIGLFFGSTLA